MQYCYYAGLLYLSPLFELCPAHTLLCRMSTPEVPAVTEDENNLKRKSSDIEWEWGRLCDPNDKNRVKCLLCGHESTSGINRFKQHLAWVGTSVAKCSKVTEEIKLKCNKDLEETARKKRRRSSSMTKMLGTTFRFQQHQQRKW